MLNNTIVGAYLFIDYNKTPSPNHFTVLNPGIEFMTNQWDGHLNGYFPVGPKSKLMGVFTGTQLGMSNRTFFRGHFIFDSLFNLIEDVGPGVDLEVGHTFNTFSYLKRTRVFAGGYHFTPPFTSNVNGVEVGFEMPLKYKWATVEARDSYDNINHNTFVLMLRITFGGLDKSESMDIHDRMLDRIPRHLGNLDSGDGIPSKKAYNNDGLTEIAFNTKTATSPLNVNKEAVVDTNKVVLRDNVWFFIPNGTPTPIQGIQSCTFEHPCFGLAQLQIDTINSISPNANFYLSSGTYGNPDPVTPYSFRYGQNVFGKTSNFSQLATGNDRPLLTNSLFLEGNNNIYNLRINGKSMRDLETGGMVVPFQVGVLVRSFSRDVVNIYNTAITSDSTASNAIALANNSNVSLLNIYNSNMNSRITNFPGGISVGAGNLQTGGFNIYNSSISVSNTNAVNSFSLAFGFVNNESGLVNISNSTISANLVHGGLLAGVLNNSSLGLGLGTVTISGSTINVNGIDASLVGGIFNQPTTGGVSANVDISQSRIFVTSNNNGGGTVAGILTSGTGTASIRNSQIYGTADSGSVSGIVVGDPTATANFENTIISLTTSGTAVGTPTQNAGTLNNQGGNQCFENGLPVAC